MLRDPIDSLRHLARVRARKEAYRAYLRTCSLSLLHAHQCAWKTTLARALSDGELATAALMLAMIRRHLTREILVPSVG